MEALIDNIIERLVRQRLSRPQCATRLQVQGVHLRAEAKRCRRARREGSMVVSAVNPTGERPARLGFRMIGKPAR